MGSPCGCARSTGATCSCSGEVARTSPSVSTRSGLRQAPRAPVELPRFKHTSDVFTTPASVRCNPGRTPGRSSDRRRSGASRQGNAHARSSLNFGRPTVMARRWCRRSGPCDGGSPRLAGSEQRNRPRSGKRDTVCVFHRSISDLASERSHAGGCRTRSSSGCIHGRTIPRRQRDQPCGSIRCAVRQSHSGSRHERRGPSTSMPRSEALPSRARARRRAGSARR